MTAGALLAWGFPAWVAVLALRHGPRPGRLLPAVLAEFGLLAAVLHLAATPLRLLLLLPYACLFTLGYCYQGRSGRALDPGVVGFALRERDNVRIILRDRFRGRDWVVLGVSAATALLAAWAPGGQAGDDWWLLAAAGLGLLLAFAAAGVALPPVPNLLAAFSVALHRRLLHPGLGKPQRLAMAAPARADGPRPDILLIVCESLCKRILESPAGRAATPRYHAFLAAEAARIAGFDQALCNSSSSDISYASLLTGLSPDESRERFHRTPLLWSAAKAAGYRTALYTSQSLRWANLDRFLLDATLDRAVYRERLRAPVVNDLAMDDRVVNALAIGELARGGGPSCAVVNYNMLHAPFFSGEAGGTAPADAALPRYLAALSLFDACIGDLLDSLRVSGALERTAVCFTADHGERPEDYDRGGPGRLPERLDDLSLDTLAVPFWIRIPEGGCSPAELATLHANRGATVANVDIYPTLLDLLGFSAAQRAALASGHSLLRPLPAGRTVVALNSNAFRNWVFEPFALAREGWLLIYHDNRRAYTLTRLDDPEQRDVWPELSAAARRSWLAPVDRQPGPRDIAARRREAGAAGMP
jgi:hypothetical protein